MIKQAIKAKTTIPPLWGQESPTKADYEKVYRTKNQTVMMTTTTTTTMTMTLTTMRMMTMIMMMMMVMMMLVVIMMSWRASQHYMNNLPSVRLNDCHHYIDPNGTAYFQKWRCP